MKKLISAICAVLISVGSLGMAGTANAAPVTIQTPVETTRTATADTNIQKIDHRRSHRWDRRDHRRWDRRHHSRRWDRHHSRRWDRHHSRRWERHHSHRRWDRPHRRHYERTGTQIILDL
ncbi:MAG: hypothetical protein ACREIP_03130 [Alphaproteobacteria bacterium]